jgi:transposase
MNSVALSAGPIHLGLDTSKNKIAVGILRPDETVPDTEVIFNDEASVRRLVDRFADRGLLRVCYEAGPTGFGLYRLLHSMGVACEVVAPSLIPRAPADRVKTDRRDCRRLARLHRAGELTAIRVPTEAEEAVRDLCRARAAVVGDRTRIRHRLSKFLLRHDRIWRDKQWTLKHEQWLLCQQFDEAALRATYAHYRAMLIARDAELAAVDADLAYWFDHGPFADTVARLAAYRGVAYLGALTIASEVG